MKQDEFIEKVFELAFGDNAINKEYTFEQAYTELKEFSVLALQFLD